MSSLLNNRDIVIGLGANVASRLSHLRTASQSIADLSGVKVVSRSLVYETDPVGPEQSPFLNAAMRISTRFDPEAIQEKLLSIETRHGRVPSKERTLWQPRPIDLDILWIFDRGVSIFLTGPTLIVPHPGLHVRPFMYVPLLEVAPELSAQIALWQAERVRESGNTSSTLKPYRYRAHDCW